MRVARVPGAAAVAESDPLGLPDGGQALEDGGGAVGAELGLVELGLVDARVDGAVGVQVEGVPGEGEGVGWVGGFMGCDGAREAAETDVAPLDGSWFSVWFGFRGGQVEHTGQTVSEMIWTLMLVMVGGCLYLGVEVL